VPVEQLVVAQQTMEALLEVFSAVAQDNTNIDQTMDTITGACCKALDAERVNLFFVDHVSQQLWCRSTQRLDDRGGAYQQGGDDSGGMSPAAVSPALSSRGMDSNTNGNSPMSIASRVGGRVGGWVGEDESEPSRIRSALEAGRRQ
jgi:hypothetical protein